MKTKSKTLYKWFVVKKGRPVLSGYWCYSYRDQNGNPVTKLKPGLEMETIKLVQMCSSGYHAVTKSQADLWKMYSTVGQLQLWKVKLHGTIKRQRNEGATKYVAGNMRLIKRVYLKDLS